MQYAHIFLEIFLLVFFFEVSKGALTTMLRVGSASEVSVFGLWNETSAYCDKGNMVYRHDYIDRMDNSCLNAINLHFKTSTTDFIIRFNKPFSAFNIETILSSFPDKMEDGTDIRTIFPHAVFINENSYEFLLVNAIHTTMYAAIYYNETDTSSPKFGISFPGMQYDDVVQMWVSRITGFSSEYTQEPGWTAAELLGPNDFYPDYGDRPLNWSPYTCCKANEFLQVGFPDKVYIEKVDIYETFHGGAVKRISALTNFGSWVTVWEATTLEVHTQSRIFSPVFPRLTFASDELKIDIDASFVNAFIQIDAILVTGRMLGHEIPLNLTTDRPVSYLEIVADTMDTVACQAILLPVNNSHCQGPTVTVPISSAGAMTGTSLTLSCDIKSNLKVTSMSWTREGVQVAIDNSKYEISTDFMVGASNLTINNLQSSDNGNYVCHATDGMGVGQSTPIKVETMCDCSCAYKETLDYWATHAKENHTLEEWKVILEPVLQEIRQNLTVDKETLSATIRKQTCAKDGRQSSKYLGTMGITFIVLVTFLIILTDLTSIVSRATIHVTT